MAAAERRAANAPWPIPPGQVVVSVNGYPLALRDEGAGEALLLIHGSLSDSRSWSAQVAAFADRFRVLAPSLRHCYPERWDGRGDDYTLRQHADDLCALLDALAIAGAHVVGHSRGGAVALSMLHRHPDRLRSLTLADPRGLEPLLAASPDDARMAREIGATFAELQRRLAAGDVEQGARGFVDALGGAGAWERRSAAEKAMFLDNIATAVDPGELPAIDRQQLQALAMPLLLITGERSPARYGRMFAALRAVNPRIAEPVVVPAAAHAMQRENPAGFNAALARFLDSQAPAGLSPRR